MHGRKSNKSNPHQSRRSFLQTTLGLAGGLALPAGFAARAFAADHPAIGTYPAGSTGDSVFIGIAVPRTGTYAVQGEDELKGYQLAVEHINAGHPLIRQISPRTKKGVLGKQVKFGVADSAAKPNDAVQAEQRFITENNAILMTGSTSSAVAVALNKLAQREKVLYLAGISGSNDTTGKDCVRYGFRQCFYGQTAAAAIGPIVVKTFGKNKKAAYLTPDYTYGHTVTKSMSDYLNNNAGWTTATDQVAPLGAPDYSSYLLNVANSGADVLLNVNWGHDAVLSTQQAKQFGIFDKMKPAGRRLCRYGLLVDARGQVPARQDVRRGVRQEVRVQAGMGRQQCLHGIRPLGRGGGKCRHLLPAGRHQVLRAGTEDPVDRRRGLFPQGRPPARAPCGHCQGQSAKRNEEQGRLLRGRRDRSRGPVDADPRRVRLQPRFVYLELWRRRDDTAGGAFAVRGFTYARTRGPARARPDG
jgi:ABC-type branched-subunit amino acid transport system substrate-binding protein